MSVLGLDAGTSSDPSVGIVAEADGSASAATRADAAALASVLARFATSSGMSAAGAPGDASRFAPVPTGIASSECGGSLTEASRINDGGGAAVPIDAAVYCGQYRENHGPGYNLK